MLAFSAGSALAALDLKVDVGCPGQEGAGNLKAGWTAFDGTACSGAVGPVTVPNLGGLGIDVTLTVGNTSDNAYRSPGEYTGDELGRDYVTADDSVSQQECTVTMTLSNLPAAEYTLTTYHNCSDRPETMPTIDVTVSGSGVVGTPTNATGAAQTSLSQSVQFEQLGKAVVQFVADGVGDVVITFVPREQAYKWRVYLNGFELSGASLVPRIQYESASSGDPETVSPALIGVVLERPEEGQTYTVDYAAVGGTATAGADYYMPTSGGPACWNYPTQCHGDCDNDANVKGSDFLALKSSWYQCDPDANYNPCADFDHDGCVKGSDFLILKSNWYQTVEANCPPAGGGNTLTFNPGETRKTIDVDIIDDGLDEEDETIVLQLLNPVGPNVELGSITEHTYTIMDPRPYVQFTAPSGSGAEEDTPVEVAVSLSHISDETVTVNYAVTGGTATNGVDYVLASPGTVTFYAGEISKTISISVVDDEEEEGIETIVLTLSDPTNAKLGGSTTYTYTISDLAYPEFPDSDTVGLWLFDEDDYPHTTLTDASEYEKADLCLMDGGHMVAGKYGRALQVSGSNYAVCYAGFAGKVPEEELREEDGTPSGLWGPTEGSGPLLNGLAGSTWTVELWLKISSAGSSASIIDLGWAYDPGFSLGLSGSSLVIISNYGGIQATCPTNLATLTNGQWHHVAFTRNGSAVRHFLDGVEQASPAVSSVPVQPIPDLQVPYDREHESRGFETMSYEQRRQNRFNFAVGTDRHAGNSMSCMVDEMRISRVVRYIGNFAPQCFSRNYGPAALPPSAADGPALLFNPGPVSIPLDFGARKHVFIDTAILDSMSGLQITMNRPYGKQEIGKNFSIDSSGWRPSVFDIDGVVYLAIPEGYGSSQGRTFLATSADGLNFTMQGTIITEVPFYGSFFKDLNPNVAPEEQYKVNAFVANRGMYFYISPDGVNWRRNETIQLALRSGGEGECFWDDQRGRYASYLKRDSSFDDPECADQPGRVAVGFWSNEILKSWPFYHLVTPYFEGYPFPSVTCEGPVEFGVTEATQVYRTRAIKYPWAPDVYLAFIWRYPGDDQPRHVELAVCRDGESWNFFGTNWYIPLGAAEEELSLYGLIRRGDEIWQYIDEGGAHGGGAPRTYYRYRQRLDGFVSLDAGGTTATATTHPLTFEGQALRLNVKATGSVKVAITNQAGTELPGFALADCDTITADSTAYQVTWGGTGDVSSLQGQVVRLKFQAQNAKLYAFEFGN
jgi:hypothetical protein